MMRMGQLRREKGQSLVEFALISGVLVLMLMGIFDFSRAIYAYNVIANCAREGARAGIIDPNNTVGITEAAMDKAIGLDPAQLTVNVTLGSETVRVEVTYNFYAVTPLITQFFGGGEYLELKSVATMYVEGQ